MCVVKALLGKDGRNRVFMAFSIPAMVLYTVFFVAPMFIGILYGFSDWNGLTGDVRWIGLKNYADILTDERALQSAWFTTRYVVLLILAVNGLALLLAVMMESFIGDKLRGFFRSLFFFPAVLSMMTVGLIWNEIFYRVLPLIGQAFGIPALSGNLLSSTGGAMLGILIVHVWQGVSIPLVLMIAGLQTVPRELQEAARLDGASGLRLFRSITLPFLVPVMNVTLILTLRGGLTVFDYIKVMTNGGPAGSTESFTLFIFNRGIADLRYGYASAASVLLMLVIGVVSVVQMRWTSKGEAGQQ